MAQLALSLLRNCSHYALPEDFDLRFSIVLSGPVGLVIGRLWSLTAAEPDTCGGDPVTDHELTKRVIALTLLMLNSACGGQKDSNVDLDLVKGKIVKLQLATRRTVGESFLVWLNGCTSGTLALS